MNRKEVPLRELLRLRDARMAWLVLLIGLLVTVSLWALSLRLIEDRTESSFRIQSMQFPHDSEDPGLLMKYADMAMYRAKERGGRHRTCPETSSDRGS